MKRKLLYIALFCLAALFVQCYPEAYRILGFDKMEFYENHTGSTDTWHGYTFELKIALETKEVNPRYVQCLDLISPVERCYAMSMPVMVYYNEPDLKSAELLLDRDIVYDKKTIAAGTDILSLADKVTISDHHITITFGNSEQSPSIEMADGDVMLLFRCDVGGEKMSITKTVTVDFIQ